MEIQDIIPGLTATEIASITSPEERTLIVNTTLQQAVIYVNGSFKQASFENTDDIPEGINKFVTSSDLSQITTNANNINSLQTNKEDVFAKNSAFNKDFGTNAGDVLEGNTTTITPAQASDIQSNNAKVSFPEAPNDGKQYARKNLAWEEVVSSSSPEPLPIITLTSNDTSTTISQSSPTILGWNIEREKDNGFTHSTSINNSRLTVDEDGTYQPHVNITLFSTGQRAQFVGKILIDGVVQSQPYHGGYIRNSGSSSDYWTCEIEPEPIKLTAGQYIEFQIQIDSQITTSITGVFQGDKSSCSLLKLQGSKGEKGDAGSGSNIIVQKNGSTVGTLTDSINILGGVPVIDQGSNKTSIEIGNYAHATGLTQIPSSQITETSITTGSIDNYNLGNFNVHFINPGNSDRPFSGMVAPPSGVNRIVVIINSGTNGKIKFENNNNSSIPANRILLADNNNFDLPRGGSVQFIYKHSSNRWITYSYY